jgi:hypothetical protein
MNHKTTITLSTLPSNRSVGLIFVALFMLIALFPIAYGRDIHIWALILSGGFGLIVFLAPQLLTPLTKYWMGLAHIFHKIVSPIVLGVIFFLVLAPVGCLMRLSGKDPLKLKLEPTAQTYWQERLPPSTDPESLLNQF